jgi:invasion protein IalB
MAFIVALSLTSGDLAQLRRLTAGMRGLFDGTVLLATCRRYRPNRKAINMKHRILVVLAAWAVLAGLSASPAVSQEATATAPDEISETYGAWTLRCGPGETRCHVLQALIRPKDKARLLQVTLFSPPGAEGALFLRALTPLGGMLTDGLALIVDEAEPKNAPFVSCWPRGCIAEMPLSSRLEKSLRAGKTLAIQVVSAENGQTVRFELSLDGISAALNRFSEM